MGSVLTKDGIGVDSSKKNFQDSKAVAKSTRVFQHRSTREVMVLVDNHGPAVLAGKMLLQGNVSDWKELHMSDTQRTYLDMLPSLMSKEGEKKHASNWLRKNKDASSVAPLSNISDAERVAYRKPFNRPDEADADHEKDERQWNQMVTQLGDQQEAHVEVTRSVQRELDQDNRSIQNIYIALSHQNHLEMNLSIKQAIESFENRCQLNQEMHHLAKSIMRFDGSNGRVDQIYAYKRMIGNLIDDLRFEQARPARSRGGGRSSGMERGGNSKEAEGEDFDIDGGKSDRGDRGERRSTGRDSDGGKEQNAEDFPRSAQRPISIDSASRASFATHDTIFSVLNDNEIENYIDLMEKLYSFTDTKTKVIDSYKTSFRFENLDVTNGIHHGHFSSTYLARREQGNGTTCYLAVKVMETSVLKRSQLEHAVCSEKIVMGKCSAFDQYFQRTIGAFRTHEHLFLVSEFIPGGSLDTLLYEHEQRRLQNTGQTAVGKDREFPLAAIRVIFKEICAAVNCLHLHHIIHNEIHPENILITHNGHIKLCDFSSVMHKGDSISPLTGATHAKFYEKSQELPGWLSAIDKPKQQSSFDADAISDSRWSSSDMGSMDSAHSGFYSIDGDDREQKNVKPLRSIVVNSNNANYIAPEVHMHNMYSSASDWWAAGVILYRMIFGSLPFGDVRERDEIIRERVIALDMDTHGFDHPSCPAVALQMVEGFLQNRITRIGVDAEEEILGHPFLDKVDLTSAYLRKGPINTRPSFDDPLACFPAVPHVPDGRDVHEVKMNISLAMKNSGDTVVFNPEFAVFPIA